MGEGRGGAPDPLKEALTDTLTVTFPKGSAQIIGDFSHTFVSNHERSPPPPPDHRTRGSVTAIKQPGPLDRPPQARRAGQAGRSRRIGPRGGDTSPCHACPCITAPQPGVSRREQGGGGGGGGYMGGRRRRWRRRSAGTPPVSRD